MQHHRNSGGGVNSPETPCSVLPLPMRTFLVPGMRFSLPAWMTPLIPWLNLIYRSPGTFQEPDGKQSRGFLPRHPAGTGAAASTSRVCNQRRICQQDVLHRNSLFPVSPWDWQDGALGCSRGETTTVLGCFPSQLCTVVTTPGYLHSVSMAEGKWLLLSPCTRS